MSGEKTKMRCRRGIAVLCLLDWASQRKCCRSLCDAEAWHLPVNSVQAGGQCRRLTWAVGAKWHVMVCPTQSGGGGCKICAVFFPVVIKLRNSRKLGNLRIIYIESFLPKTFSFEFRSASWWCWPRNWKNTQDHTGWDAGWHHLGGLVRVPR